MDYTRDDILRKPAAREPLVLKAEPDAMRDARLGRMSHVSRRRVQCCAALLTLGVSLASCGGTHGTSSTSHATARSSVLAAKLVAAIAPVDGADVSAGTTLFNTAAAIRERKIAACTSAVGFNQVLPTGIVQMPYGDATFPNLAAIEHAHRLDLVVPASQSDQGGDHSISSMSSAEKRAYDAAYARCSHKVGSHGNPLAALRGPSALALTNTWASIISGVEASSKVVALSHVAQACLSAHRSPATSLSALYLRYVGKEIMLLRRGGDPAPVDEQAAQLVMECFPPVIDEVTKQLRARRATFLSRNALTFNALAQEVASKER